MDLRIPRKFQAGFKALYGLSDENKQQLVTVLSEARRGSSTQDLTVKVSLTLGLGLEASQSLINALTAFYSVVDHLVEENGKAEFIEALPAALVESKVVPDGTDTTTMIQVVSSALELKETLGVIAKAKELATDSERLFASSRILTDFRPIFSDNLDETIEAGVVLHQLRITYHKEESEHPEFFVSLDSEDLRKLKETIVRAEKKEEKLKKELESKGISLLSMDGLHSII
jgi:hypothetical protein